MLRNMQHLANLLRPAQARQTLLHTLEGEVAARRAAAQELRWARRMGMGTAGGSMPSGRYVVRVP